MNNACRPFEKEEIPLMIKGFDAHGFALRNKALFTLGINTGYRINELLSLRIRDVYDYRGNVHDRIKVPKHLMKGNQPRPAKKVYPESRAYLEAWYKRLSSDFNSTRSSWVFVSRKGGAIGPNAAWRIFKTVAEEMNIPAKEIGTHSMRKTFANAVYDYWVEAARRGRRVEPMRMVQLELGHSNIEDTYRYMAFKMEEKPDDVFAEYNMLEDIVLSK